MQARARPPTVFVVDDDYAVRNSLKFLLELDGFAVEIYGSARELLGSPRWRNGDCFVIDQNMPDMSGIELITLLKRLGSTTPTILITTHASDTLLERAQRQEAKIIEKPLLGTNLSDCVRFACETGQIAR